ncbi:MAG: hypothetical protein JWP81_2118 [Ferruginibacter sp.]|nr:hypothetical protein [Ferruginibacter sp.]
MKKQFCFVLIVCLLHLVDEAQVLTGKIRKPRSNSFYSEAHYKNDYLPGRAISPGTNGAPRRAVWRNEKNSPNKVIDNLENPPGTLVLDGASELDDLKALINHPDEVLIKGRINNIPYKNGETIYRIPVTSSTSHHSLYDPPVLKEFNAFIDNCVLVKKEVPASVRLSHNNDLQACEFLSFKSISNLYSEPYFQRRLNLSCVFLNRFSKDYYCYGK